MSRCFAVGIALLPTLVAVPLGMASPPTNASVKLWLDTNADNPCEQATPSSGDWTIRNNERRDVHIVLHRATTKNDATTEDQVQDILGPQETRDLGCEISDGGRQTLTLVKANY